MAVTDSANASCYETKTGVAHTRADLAVSLPTTFLACGRHIAATRPKPVERPGSYIFDKVAVDRPNHQEVITPLARRQLGGLACSEGTGGYVIRVRCSTAGLVKESETPRNHIRPTGSVLWTRRCDSLTVVKQPFRSVSGSGVDGGVTLRPTMERLFWVADFIRRMFGA